MLLQAPSHGRVLLDLSQLRRIFFLLLQTVRGASSGKLLPRFVFGSCHPWSGFIVFSIPCPVRAVREFHCWGSLKALPLADALMLPGMSMLTSSFSAPLFTSEETFQTQHRNEKMAFIFNVQ